MPKNVVSVRVLSERIQTDQSLAALARFTKLFQKLFLAVNLDLKISQNSFFISTSISTNVRQKAKGKTFQDLLFFNPAQMSALLAIYTTKRFEIMLIEIKFTFYIVFDVFVFKTA